jgi:hypothetical protein
MSYAMIAERPAEAPHGPGTIENRQPGETTRDMLRKMLLACGVVSSALYVSAELYAWTQYPGYSPIFHVYSELLAEGAPTRPILIVIVGAPYNLLVAAFAAGVWLSAAHASSILRCMR